MWLKRWTGSRTKECEIRIHGWYVGGPNVDGPHRDGVTGCGRVVEKNKGMVEWTNMSVINRPIKNSKLAETMRTLRKM